MQGIHIFSIGFERNRWLAARLSVIATNVANADTPGYKARDVMPFEATLTAARSDHQRATIGHLPVEEHLGRTFDMVPRDGVSSKHSGNGVSLETEMARLGDARSQQSMVTGVLGAFHRMLLSSAKG